MAINRSPSSGNKSSGSSRSGGGSFSRANRSGSGGSRPRSRERNSSAEYSRSTARRGGGLNLGGPVGNSGGYDDRPGTGYYEERGGGGGAGVWIAVLVVLIIFVSLGGGGSLTNTFESIFHSVAASTDESDSIADRFSSALQGIGGGFLGEDSGRSTSSTSARTTSVASRSMVTQFSGLLAGDGDRVVQALAGDFVATRQDVGSIDPEKFYWSTNSAGQNVLKLTDDEWELVETVKLNVFIDDGEGFIDLGLDPLFDFDDNLDLIGEYDGTWLCIDRYPAAFYHLTTIENDNDEYRIIGYVPAFLNDQHVNLIIAFDNATPEGYIAGAKVIENGPGSDLSVEEMVSGLIAVKEGDVVDFICDYYDYNGEFINNYLFGEQMVVSADPEIKNYRIPGDLTACYRIEDVNGNHYWTPVME
ncbi:MAG: hypothetical protein E7474_12655 [Ruminococcaceae bacterium]|nr:hypothetical protein [Oscillospiraceae bacterium]